MALQTYNQQVVFSTNLGGMTQIDEPTIQPIKSKGDDMRKLKDIWLMLKSKHYVVLTADSEEEISWAIESLRKADDESKKA